MLRFRFSAEKFVNAVAYLARSCPGSTKMTVCKHLFFADREHLLKYGRPITGDHYYKLEHGPIPTVGLNMLRGKADPARNALMKEYVSVEGTTVRPRKDADRSVFSKSDLEILEWVVEKYGCWSAAALRRKSHRQAAWLQSDDTGIIDFALFFEGEPSATVMKELAEAEQESRDLLRPYAAR